MATCRSCGAEIVWGKTKAGKSMPIDPGPVASGNILLTENGTCYVHPSPEIRRVFSEVPMRTSHFATCPDAGKFRR